MLITECVILYNERQKIDKKQSRIFQTWGKQAVRAERTLTRKNERQVKKRESFLYEVVASFLPCLRFHFFLILDEIIRF